MATHSSSNSTRECDASSARTVRTVEKVPTLDRSRYLTSEDLKDKTNTLAHLSMEEILAMADELDKEDEKTENDEKDREMNQNG